MKTRGHIAVFILVFIVAAGLLLQGLVQWTLSDERAGREVDRALQRRAELATIEEIVRQSIYTHYESALSGTPPTIVALIDDGLTDLTASEVARVAVPNLPSATPSTLHGAFAAETDGATVTLNGSFNALSSSTFATGLRRVDNFRLPHLPPIGIRDGATETFDFDFTRGAPESLSYRVRARLWQVPISDFEIIAYGKPSANALPALSVLPALVGNSLADPSVRAGLALTTLSSGSGAVSDVDGQPTTQRELVAVTGVIWDYVWSPNFRNDFIGSLAANHAIALDAPPLTSDLPAGVSVDTGAGKISVAISEVSGSALYLSGYAAGGGTVELTQGAGGVTTPLVVYITGGTSGAPVNLVFALSLTRPIVIYLVNGDIVAPPSARSMTGALFLGADSTINNGAPLAVSFTISGSFAASISGWPDLTNITVNRTVSPSWRGRVPRTLLVQVEGSLQ